MAKGPGGVIYVTGNSASGSKYYDLTTPRAGSDFGPDPLDPTGKRHFANSVENQEHVRTYVKVQARNDALVVENIRSGTCAAPNAAVEVGNVSWCGPDSGATPAQPVGSVVDKVVIHEAEAPPVDAAVGGDVTADALAHARHAGRVRRRSRPASRRTTRRRPSRRSSRPRATRR